MRDGGLVKGARDLCLGWAGWGGAGRGGEEGFWWCFARMRDGVKEIKFGRSVYGLGLWVYESGIGIRHSKCREVWAEAGETGRVCVCLQSRKG